MSMHVYVTSLEAFKALPGFRDCKLYSDNGRWYAILSDWAEAVPTLIVSIVDEISWIGHIPANPPREIGRYVHESAKATLDGVVECASKGGPGKIKLVIVAKKMEDLLELRHRIRVGSIRPVESFEGPQGGKSRTELEAEIDALKVKLDLVGGSREYARSNNDRMLKTLFGISAALNGLSNSRWPLMVRKSAIEKLRAELQAGVAERGKDRDALGRELEA